MRSNPLPLIAAFIFIHLSASSQGDQKFNLLLKSGSFLPPKNITTDFINSFNVRIRTAEQLFAIIQFENIPTPAEKQLLLSAGIELMDYIPGNAYSVSIKKIVNEIFLRQLKVRAIIELTPAQKLQPPLNYGIAPSWSVKTRGSVDVWISFYKTVSYESVEELLRLKNFDIISSDYKNYHVIGVRITLQRLNELASIPFIEFIQPAQTTDQPLNGWTNWNRDGLKASLLSAPLSSGGRDLKGNNVVVGIGDNADPHLHVDFTKRYINRAAADYGFHGTHVTGIVGGAGIRDELRTGFAPKATLINQVFSNIIKNAGAYVNDYGMVITNNSYGNIVSDCDYFGLYDIYSRILDQQAFDYPFLENVFAAGNSGLVYCPPYPDSFRTVLGSYQSAKNVLTVGNATPIGYLFQTSSRGPARDGRIKPEIISIGSFIMSAAPPPFDYYWENTGTSMAAPAVSGGVALLYQRYRQLHGGANPKNALIKSFVCNSGNDWGNNGPDFSHGFGLVNFWRALDMMENNHYYAGSIANSGLNTSSITVPPGMAELKLILYWNDPPASALASQTLVNDLDLELVDPSTNVVLPLVLDTLPSQIKNAAINGADHINNIEQVVIKNPVAGNYTIRVKGTSVTQGPQEYFITYDFVPFETKLVAPIGGDSYVPGEKLMIQWDSYGDPSNPFTIQFSFDNGATWINDSTAAAGIRFHGWVVPSMSTDQAKIRITRNGTAYTSTSLPYTIMPLPTLTLSPVQCEGYMSVDWTAVAGATDYEIFMLEGDAMVSKVIVPNTTLGYTFSGLSKDSVYWVSVRPRINGNAGRRAIAIKRQPNSGNCAGSISDNDLKIDSLILPTSGRAFTSTTLTASATISVRIRNLDDAAVNNFDVKYSVNGGAWVTESIATPVAAGATYIHNFTSPYDFSTAGNYTLKLVVRNTSATDPVNVNDTASVLIKQLSNAPIILVIGSDFLDNIETASDSTYYSRQTGLQGGDRYDFVSSSAYGRLRTFVNTGIAYSGSKALTMDADQYNTGTTDSLTATFNISSYNAAVDDIRLDFFFKHHGQAANAANKVWIRGDDTKPWVQVYDLFANQGLGEYKKSSSIELGDALVAAGQNFSTSFQVRWGQWGQWITGASGYSFDDIHLYKVSDDIQMLSIDEPLINSCGLSNLTSIKVTVRNSVNSTITNIPVMYRIDGGSWISETIPSIAANSSLQYTFSTKADLSVFSDYHIETKVQYGTDSYPDNDTTSTRIVNSPVYTSFPYLQDFESGNGSWYTGGIKSSWEFGTPASVKIKTAASGIKAWKTRLWSNYNDDELSYLYSPCFDISNMTNPSLSLSLALDIEDCGGSLCDAAWVEYSTDGITWNKLGVFGSGTNWYNKNYSAGANPLWSVENYTRWHVATCVLPTGLSRLRLRFVMSSDAGVSREGIAIDDIHIYDNTNGIYDGGTMASPVTQTVSGDTWVDLLDAGTNKLIASVHPNNQNLGLTDAQAFIYPGAVRFNASQYYHNRNITIIPANYNLVDSATVRFYFLDTETESLINATGCALCSKPASGYELGVSKYTDPSARINEDGTILNDIQGTWSFILPANAIKVPFDKGYYAEFKVKEFSEFWLNNGGFTGSSSLPLKLISFSATKQSNNDVLVSWKTEQEFNVHHFDLEVARGSNDYQSGNFIKIGEVAGQGNSSSGNQYHFIDDENNKTGVRYYRLKIIDNDGSYTYSVIRPVIFNKEVKSYVYPNPSYGVFNLIFQENAGETFKVTVYDITGKQVQQSRVIASGFVEKIVIDLQPEKFAGGLYMIIAEGNKKESFKVLKQ